MPNILVIDDDASFCLMLKSFFTKNGYNVSVAFSLKDGVKLSNEQHFDIVLTDYRLPDGNGIELLNSVKRNTPDTVVILMTGYADIKIAVNAVKMGAFKGAHFYGINGNLYVGIACHKDNYGVGSIALYRV